MLTSEHIRNQAPLGAVSYRLLAKRSDGSSRLFPADAVGFFRLGEPPANVPIGKYTICYYDSANSLIKYLDDAIELGAGAESPLSQPTAMGQLQLSFLNATGGAAPTASKSQRPTLAAVPELRTLPGRFDAEGAPLSEGELEFRRHLQAMDLEDRQQEFIKSSAYVTELGETFTLNRLLRRDLLEMHRIVVAHSQRAYQDIDQVKGTIHDLLALQKAVLEHAATAISRPPPPPPDYVGLGHSALAVVKEVSAALITRSMGRELASLSRGAQTEAKAQISDGALAKEAEISKASAPAEKGDAETVKGTSGAAVSAPRDALAKLVQQLQGLSDAELATAMSSVEGWKALLDSLRKGETDSADTTQKTSVVTSEDVALAKS